MSTIRGNRSIAQSPSPSRLPDEWSGYEAATDGSVSDPDVLQLVATIQNGLIDLVLASVGTGALIDYLAAAIRNPVALGDPLFHLVASSPAGEHGDRHRREAVLGRGTPRNVLDDPVVGSYFHQAAESRRPTLFPAFPEHGMEKRRLMAPALAGEEILGYLTVLEDRPFDSSDPTILEYAAKIVALELHNRRIALDTELHLMADFLGDLLSGRVTNKDALVRRAGFLGIDLFRSWTLLIVEADDLNQMMAATRSENPVITLHRLFELVRHRVRQKFRHGIVVVQGESVVVLHPSQNGTSKPGTRPETVALDLHDEMRRMVPEATISVAVSGHCENLGEFPVRYEEARRALAVARSLSRVSATVSFEEFGLYGLLFRREDTAHLSRFADRMLGALLEYDGARKTQLVQTVQAYLDEGAGFRPTARRLGIHLNTLRARLDRIEQITGIDLSNPHSRVELSIALEIASTMGDLRLRVGESVLRSTW